MKAIVAKILEATLERAQASGALPPWPGAPAALQTLDAPKNAAHGDWASNVAMLYAKAAGQKPRDLAQKIVEQLVDPDHAVAALEVAGPGFLNFRLSPDVWWNELAAVERQGRAFGRSQAGLGKKVDVEFVSVNPTGPMHVGHGRGAVTGDAISALLQATGHEVTREYYINDAGNQIRTLARSVQLRYRELFGEKIALPEELYPGEYVIAIAEEVRREHGERYRNAPESEWLEPFASLAVERVLAMIRDDLQALGIRFDVWFSEKQRLHADRRAASCARRLPQARPALRQGRRGVLPVDSARRRQGPAGGEEQRRAHLPCRRHRLPQGQVRPRLRLVPQRLGRRSPRRHRAGQGGGRRSWASIPSGSGS